MIPLIAVAQLWQVREVYNRALGVSEVARRRAKRLTLLALAVTPLFLGLWPSVPHPFIHSFMWWVPIPRRVNVPVPDGSPGERVLVMSPHPDDDVLALGATIAQLRQEGHSVLVVFLTSGDANQAGQMLLTLNPLHRAADYRSLGYRRQKEAVLALRILEVPETHALFLGYPDGGLKELWVNHWERDAPYISPQTRADRSPYRNTYNPEAVYAGQDLLGDLVDIVARFRPTIVYVPHEEDGHPDHQAAFYFSMGALAHAAPEILPEIRLYLVHVPQWPVPRQLIPELALEPPLVYGDWTWETVEFCEEIVDLKLAAVRAHSSQRWTNGRFLARFVRSTEVYAVPTPATAPLRPLPRY